MASEQAESGPIQQTDTGSFYVTGYQEAKRILADERFSSKLHDPTNSGLLDPQTMGISMQLCDPPEHTRLRRFISAHFSARSCELLRPIVQQTADELLATIQDRGGGDLVADLAYPLPFRTICMILGIPDEDKDKVFQVAEESLNVTDSEQVALAVKELTGYFCRLLDIKKTQPGNDLSTKLAAARANGQLSHDEAVGTARLLLIAGYETMVSFIANAGLVLLFDKNYQQGLRNNLNLIPAAVEELLRYVSPTRVITRVAKEDLQLAEVPIPEGATVTLLLGHANRDAKNFVQGDHLRVESNESVNHLAFGHGIHYCLGAHLARMESIVVITALLQRFSKLSLAISPQEINWHKTRITRRPKSLRFVANV